MILKEYKKNEIINLKIIDMTKDGLGIAKIDNQVFFVKGAIIGDETSSVITKIDKNVIYAKSLKLIKESKFREKDNCTVSNRCGGCQLQCLRYEKQLAVKMNYAISCLNKIGKNNFKINCLDNENIKIDDIDKKVTHEGIIGAKKIKYYRNKMQVPFAKVDGKIIYGFYVGRTHNIVEFDKCDVGFEFAEKILNIVRKAITKYKISVYDEKLDNGVFREVLLRIGNVSKEISTTYIINDDKYSENMSLYKEFDKYIVDEFDKCKISFCDDYNIVTSSININTSHNNVILGNISETIRGNGYICDSIGELKYHISPESFYQINMEMTRILYDKIVDFASFDGNEKVLDLYCGIGTITIYISRFVKSVIGIEMIDKAVSNAKDNLKINNINNVKFLCCDAEKMEFNDISYLRDTDIVIVDPPRKGLSKNTINFIKNIKPKKIIYISCDPATFARDTDLICHDDSNYNLKKVANVDMFPHTMHIETIALIEKE